MYVSGRVRIIVTNSTTYIRFPNFTPISGLSFTYNFPNSIFPMAVSKSEEKLLYIKMF